MAKQTTPQNTASNIVTIIVLALAALVFISLTTSGFYQVRPGEAAAIQTFGAARPEPVASPGLHWHWPWPIGATTVVQVQKSRTAEVGFHTLPEGKTGVLTGENWERDLLAATMITGDLGLLETQLVAHYYISDLNAWLYQADDPGYTFEYTDGNRVRNFQTHPRGLPDGQTLKDSLEIAVRRSIGQRTIDQALVSDRESVELETLQHAQDIMNRYQTGITITSVQLQEVKPPDEVQTAFDDVLQAREEKDTRINEALAFESQTLPEARGEAERIRKEAEAYRAQRINQAQGEADRFLNILKEYQASPDIIARRMYLETMDRILPRTNQVLIAGADPSALIVNLGRQTNTTVIPAPAP